MRIFARVLVLLVSFVPSVVLADLILSSPPRGTEAEERALHEPIAAAMSKWLGTPVTYEYAKDFITYSFRMREGRYDILFDGSHFASWRMSHLGYHILANLPDKLVFLVIADASNKSLANLDSLVNKKVCGQAPPQLGTLLLTSQYTNPVQEPILHAVSTEPGVYDAFKAGKCVAAILRDKAYLKMSEEERGKYRVLFTSRPVPNVTLSVSPRLTVEQRSTLVKHLTDAKTAAPAKALLDKYSRNATKLDVADLEKFEQLGALLENLSFGW